MLTNYLSLASALDFMLVFLAEGREGLYRFTYAVLKTNKTFIKTLKLEESSDLSVEDCNTKLIS